MVKTFGSLFSKFGKNAHDVDIIEFSQLNRISIPTQTYLYNYQLNV